MGGSYATREDEKNPDLRPIRAAQRLEEVWAEARDLASDLPGWRILEADEARGILVCARAGSFLRPASRITLTFESPPGIPATTVNARAESQGGIPGFSADRSCVLEFMRLLRRRVG